MSINWPETYHVWKVFPDRRELDYGLPDQASAEARCHSLREGNYDPDMVRLEVWRQAWRQAPGAAEREAVGEGELVFVLPWREGEA